MAVSEVRRRDKVMPTKDESLAKLREATMGSKGNRPDYMLCGFSTADATNILTELRRLQNFELRVLQAASGE